MKESATRTSLPSLERQRRMKARGRSLWLTRARLGIRSGASLFLFPLRSSHFQLRRAQTSKIRLLWFFISFKCSLRQTTEKVYNREDELINLIKDQKDTIKKPGLHLLYSIRGKNLELTKYILEINEGKLEKNKVEIFRQCTLYFFTRKVVISLRDLTYVNWKNMVTKNPLKLNWKLHLRKVSKVDYLDR